MGRGRIGQAHDLGQTALKHRSQNPANSFIRLHLQIVRHIILILARKKVQFLRVLMRPSHTDS